MRTANCALSVLCAPLLIMGCGGDDSGEENRAGGDSSAGSYEQIRLEPESASLEGCERADVSVYGIEPDGTEVDITGSVTFSSEPENLVVRDGKVGGIADGEATLHATLGEHTDESRVAVSKSLTGLDLVTLDEHLAVGDDGSIILSLEPGTSVEELIHPDEVDIDLSSNAVLQFERESEPLSAPGQMLSIEGVGEGSAHVTATCGGWSTEQAIEVGNPAARELRIEGGPDVVLGAEESAHLRATVERSDGTTRDVTEDADWSRVFGEDVINVSNDPGSKGQVQVKGGTAPGADIVTASYEGLETEAAVRVDAE